MSRLLPSSVRGQAVLGAAVAMTIFGLIVGIAAYVLVTQVARTSEQDIVTARIDDVVEQLGDAGLTGSDPLDIGGAQQPRPVFMQVVTADGSVIATTPGVDKAAPVCPTPPPTEIQFDTVALTIGGAETTFLREARPVDAGGEAIVVCGAVSDEPIQRLQSAVLLALLLVLPLLIGGVCLAVWLAVSRALRAVDDLRTQAEELQGKTDVSLRVQPTGDEVEELGRTLNSLLEHLRLQARSTRQFVADAGHELRNPLTTLRVALEFGEDASEEELRASMADARADLDRLEAMVQDLLALARADAMEGTNPFDRVDFAAVVLGAADGVRRTRPDVDLTLDVDPCVLEGDETGLRSLMVNLLDNAARHAVGRIDISLHSAGGVATLRVDDDGGGLRPEDCDRVFDRFVRLDEARVRDEGGSGLGLAIVASIAGVHGGSVVATPGPGGHFVLTLPERPGS
jgi:signal transduction histidine kinase